jgi:hypothetical protein
MYIVKISKKNNDKINYLIYRNYKRVDQFAKVYKFNKLKTRIVTINLLKFRRYIKKGINFYNKKI